MYHGNKELCIANETVSDKVMNNYRFLYSWGIMKPVSILVFPVGFTS